MTPADYKYWLVPIVAGAYPILLWLLGRKTTKADAARATATQVENLYIGSAKELLSTLQEELRGRNVRLAALDAEREQLRSALAEERQIFETLKQRHRDLIAFLSHTGIQIPDDLHV